MDRMAAERLLIVLWTDAIMDLLAIMMALRILHVRIRPLRVCFGAFFGAVAALVVRVMRPADAMVSVLWLPLSLCMMGMSGGCMMGLRSAIRSALTLLSCMGFLGGTVLALHGATGSLEAAYLLSGACAAAVFVAAMRARRSALDVQHIRVECIITGKCLAFDAVVDSGNSLRDYLTHRPVIVAGEGLRVMSKDETWKTRPIFADTAGGRQMMHLVIPQESVLIHEGRKLTVKAALAFSPGLSPQAPALVPASLLLGEG